ncbi:PspC domain-containing protein [Streptomyces sp. NPDC007861]|uniref:PspC domain-containing protein n=1 Tax=Streptomyces sp. NPDC007861 TaxID=3154893 RepID=UPI0033F53F43
MTQPTAPPPGPPAPPPEQQSPPAPLLRRSRRQKVVAGVCGGLGRYCDIDPVIFRIAIGVLTVTGGIGLIFYGFAWLIVPAEGEEENEARRALSGRVEGAALAAVLMALLGCALFLSMLNNGGTLAFSALLTLAVAGAAVWSQRRTLVTPQGGPLDPAAAHAVSEAPPEAKAPPTPDSPSWWRDPIVKDGTTGPVATGYLWGPTDAAAAEGPPPGRAADGRGTGPGGRSPGGGMDWTVGDRGRAAASRPLAPRSIGGLVLLLVLVAGGLGTGLSWTGRPLGTSLQTGLACALAVFGIGLVVSSFLGRTGFGTILMTMVTAVLLAGASALPKEIGTEWMRTQWRPAAVAAVEPRYQLGTGAATLDLGGLAVPADAVVSTGADVGAGRLKVIVPKDATVEITAQVGLGDIRLPGDLPNDVDVAPDRRRTETLAPPVLPAGAEPGGTLTLDLEVGVGQVEVTRAAS